MDTAHTVTGQDPSGTYIEMDVCMHSPGWKNDCDRIREEAYSLCGVVVAAVCIYLLMCNLEF